MTGRSEPSLDDEKEEILLITGEAEATILSRGKFEQRELVAKPILGRRVS